MIGLSLVPAAPLVAAGLVAGEPGVAASAAKRWITDVVLVATLSGLVFGRKRWRNHRRTMWF